MTVPNETLDARVAARDAASPNAGSGGAAPGSGWYWAVPAAGLLVLIVLGWAMFQPFGNEAKGAAALLMMLVLLFLKVPVAVAMAVPAIAGIYALAGEIPLQRTLMDVPFSSVASWSLSVLPMFVFMGLMLWSSGATTRLYRGAGLWLGWLPGGLAVTTNVAGAGLAAASGSTVGITHALGRIGIPEMLRAGYDKRLALGSVLLAGMSGQLIPPSVLLVVYAGVAQVAVGPQLLAGVIPGLLVAVASAGLLVAVAVVRPRLAPRARSGTASWSERFSSVAGMAPVPLLSGLVVGGLLAGVFTATEAGAFGALGAVLIAAVTLRPRELGRALSSALRMTVSGVGQIMFLLLGTAFMGRFIALSGLPGWLVSTFDELGITRIEFLLLLILVYLVMGAFLDPIAMILLTVPVLLPIAEGYAVSPLWFGVFVVLLAELSMVTPPVGILSYVVHRLAQDPEVRGDVSIRLKDVFTAAVWVLPVALAVLLVLVFFPQLVEILVT
ncbi:TRAP transporter large permease [Prauserella muralis]|uniref:TRAP C4-dicarboxylate transport system permease DctM subunit domain-containing protein n=1 Tax=Prauserella muralis TaxID=588067 RepID=A0A2V4B3G7_9PSEU|nr:TRAP transporter large permease subunit [Prauserella muralis]PXY27695.1 hypothetical protein BAY60_14985 [Prauserella muralis]TWE22563.1 tripartite ATP-independent transporter DctM subunit [Prauserella muralis]